jgi:hypothetical protein
MKSKLFYFLLFLTLTAQAQNFTGGHLVVVRVGDGTATLNTNKISGSASVIYQARSIELKPGFKAEAGTTFKAEIGGCN